jgi:signal transduction histidine kinase
MAADQVSTAITNARRHEEQQQRLQALAELSARFRELFEQAPAGVAVMSGPEHRFEVANPIYRAITHRADLVGRRYLEVFPELVGTPLVAILDRVYHTGEPFRADAYQVTLDVEGRGLTDCFFTFHLAPVRDHDEKVVGLIVVSVEVSEQVRARQDLQQAQERLNFTLEAAGVGYWELDLATQTTKRSLQHDRIFGYPDGAPEWTLDGFLSHVPPEERERIAEAFRHALVTGDPLRLECPIVRADGVHRWIQVSARVERSTEQAAARLLGLVLDVTQRRELLDREQRARREAEHANHVKDEFLATLSHELRTPLNTILGWADLLAEGDLTAAEVRDGLAAIRRNAGAQAQMIEDLLYMSRIVSGKVHLNPRSVRLAEVVGQAVDSLRPTAEAKGVEISSHLVAAGELVAADPERLQQVFWNLLGNAIKFTPAGGRIEISLEAVDGELHVRVSDTGEGIEPDFLPHMFDRFRQGDARTTRSHGGLGIGLSIVKQLVELHGGTVSGSSAGRGAGSTFTVVLPAADRPRAEASARSARSPLGLGGVRILLVEDDPDARELLRRIFTARDATVVAAESAADAMTALRRDRFDLLVSDIGMPYEDGYDLIRQVRALPASEGGAIPAIALTAYARAGDRQRIVDAGFQRHIAKPVVQSELLSACRSLIAGGP